MVLWKPRDIGLKGCKLLIIQLKFKPSKCDPSIFTYFSEGHTIYLFIYVDNIIVIRSSSTLLQSIINKLNVAFFLKHLGGLDYFLGIEVKSVDSHSLLLTQSKYIKEILQKTMLDFSHVHTSMQSTCKLTKVFSLVISTSYMYILVVEALQYVTLTRPYIAYFINKVCQFMAHPLEAHWIVVKTIIRYLKGTITHVLHLTPLTTTISLSIQVFCDANWASNPYDRKILSGFAIYFALIWFLDGLKSNL